MNATLGFIYQNAIRLCGEKLACDEEFCRLKKESQELWARLHKRYSPEVCGAILVLVDTENLIHAMETDALFLLGLQMGLELGGLDGFPEE